MQKYSRSITITTLAFVFSTVFVLACQVHAQVTVSPSAKPQTSPTSSVVTDCYQFSKNLSTGSTGSDVVALQTWLVANGFDISGISSHRIDKGYFGQETARALSKYQAKVGLRSTGQLDVLTRAKINSSCIDSKPIPSITVLSPVYGEVLAYNKPYTITWGGTWSGSDTFTIVEFNENGKDLISSNLTQSALGCVGYGKSVCSFSWTPSYISSVEKIGVIKLITNQTPEVIGYSGIFKVSSSTPPTCYLSTDKNFYTLGDMITFFWKGQNATYAYFPEDTSGKDHLAMPGDKFPTNGSTQVTASVIGNPAVTLNVAGLSGVGSCNATFNISENISQPLSVSCAGSQHSPSALSITWWASPVGGTGSYSNYSWSAYNDVVSYDGGSTQSSKFSATYSSPGIKEAAVVVGDGKTKTNAVCRVELVAPTAPIIPTDTSIRVTSPTVFSQWRVGEKVRVTWQSVSVPTSTPVSISLLSQANIQTIITTNIVNDGSEYVTVPNVSAGNYLLRIFSADGQGMSSYFRISGGHRSSNSVRGINTPLPITASIGDLIANYFSW